MMAPTTRFVTSNVFSRRVVSPVRTAPRQAARTCGMGFILYSTRREVPAFLFRPLTGKADPPGIRASFGGLPLSEDLRCELAGLRVVRALEPAFRGIQPLEPFRCRLVCDLPFRVDRRRAELTSRSVRSNHHDVPVVNLVQRPSFELVRPVGLEDR